MKTKGFKAFLVVALRYCGEKLSLALTIKISHQRPQKNTDYAPNSAPKGILDNVLQTQKMSDHPSLTNRESPLGFIYHFHFIIACDILDLIIKKYKGLFLPLQQFNH